MDPNLRKEHLRKLLESKADVVMDMAKACNTNDMRADVVELKELESAKPLKRTSQNLQFA